ncbi:hypothetical protein [Aquaspirillum serpens]|uniref:hypothetical protein n=1 Tax=Aquaspirillum serpens TaxID=190 RepID=UPI0003B4D334|nr:hypothetical protein [Aquaspirillum serpens]
MKKRVMTPTERRMLNAEISAWRAGGKQHVFQPISLAEAKRRQARLDIEYLRDLRACAA